MRELSQIPEITTKQPKESWSSESFSFSKSSPADRKLRLIQLIGEKLIHTTDMTELADEIMSIIVAQTRADRGFLCLFDTNGSHVPLAAHGLKPGEQIRFSRTLLQRMQDQKSGVLVKDVISSKLESDSLKAMGVVSNVTVPLWTSEKIMGFMSLDMTTSRRSFTRSHLDLLIAIAHQAAVAIERARLAEVAAREQSLRFYLSKYLDSKLVEQITNQKDGTDPLAPCEREITVLFSDIVSFTKISEGMQPTEVADFVHEYLTAMTEIIFANGGVIDKYIGDSVMALFGAPLADSDSPAKAVRAALAMRDYLQNQENRRFLVRFGISTGPVVVGNIGSAQRMEYTALGDTVNVASRLESIAPPGEVVVEEETYRYLGNRFEVQKIGTVDVKNRTKPLEVYKVLAEKPAASA